MLRNRPPASTHRIFRNLLLGLAALVGSCPVLSAAAAGTTTRTATGGESARPHAGTVKDCPECPEMVMIPGGRFVMGAAAGEEDRENLHEAFRNRSRPQRAVAVTSFFAGRFEVTRGQYRAFAEATRRRDHGCFLWTGAAFALDPTKGWRDPGFAQDDTHPAACVSWEDASAYVTWLSQRTGRTYRLLTEAEWEYATRAGTTTARYWGDDIGMACGYANGADLSTRARVPGARDWDIAACDDRHAHTAPVGRFPANAFGLHDTLGNVAEWTQDCWNANYASVPTDGSAASTGDCFLRSVRGGSWEDAPVGVRAAYRVGSPVVIRVYTRGFRVARDRESALR